MEIIPNHPDYFITEKGEVYSSKTNKWLKQYPMKDGHLWVRPSTGRKSKKVFVHRLVLETFVGPCPEGMEACHNNGNPQDNRVENLRWDTHQNNAKDSARHGVLGLKGEQNARHKLTESEVKQIRYFSNVLDAKTLAKCFGVTRTQIYNIQKGNSWK